MWIKIGAFYSIQKGDGLAESTFYNPSTGNPGSTEYSNLKYETTSYGLGERLSVVGEIRLGKLSLGIRARQIKGGFADIDQLITSDMLYVNSKPEDSRLETSFNFSYGASKGLSFSGFYSSLKAETDEESDLISGQEYSTTTETKAYGVSVNYAY